MAKSLMKYHPRLGQTYMPSTRIRVPGPSGGFLVRTNAAGFRSDREVRQTCDPSVFRVLLFGDSQTAGDGLSNAQRYSDLLEAAVPGLEVENCAVSGTATDQQYLTWKEMAPATPHDLVIIAVYVENIRRIMRRVVKVRDAREAEVYRAKPYFELDGERLVLGNVPVRKQPWTDATLPDELRSHVFYYGQENILFKNPSRRLLALKRALAPLGPLRRVAKRLLTRLVKFQPVPEYDRRQSPAWLLMRQILKTWIAESHVPVLLMPLPLYFSLHGLSDARNYQARFTELAEETGCTLLDPLPEFLKLPQNKRAAVWSDAFGHLSASGHQMIAELLRTSVARFMAGRSVPRHGSPNVVPQSNDH